MEVPEHEVVHTADPGGLKRKTVQRLVLAAEMIHLVARLPVPLGPAEPDTERKARMQDAEQPLKEAAVEQLHHQTVAALRPAEHVAVAETEDLAAELDIVRLHEFLHPELLQERKSPQVVIPGAEPHLHPGVHQLHQRSYHLCAAARHHVPVFEPEVPDVTEQVQRPGPVMRNGLQKSHETGLAFRRVAYPETQMHVGREIYIAAGHPLS